MPTRNGVVDIISGYWYKVPKEGVDHECCCCGRRHRVMFQSRKGIIYWKWRLEDDEEASAERDTGKAGKGEAAEAGGVVSKGKKKDGGDTGKHARASK